MSPALPLLLAAVLAGIGTYGVLARRHAVLMLIGVELLLGAAGLILVTVGQFDIRQVGGDPLASGSVLTLFVITIAAAEIVVALAVVMAMYRTRGDVDLTGESIVSESEASEIARTVEEAPGRNHSEKVGTPSETTRKMGG